MPTGSAWRADAQLKIRRCNGERNIGADCWSIGERLFDEGGCTVGERVNGAARWSSGERKRSEARHSWVKNGAYDYCEVCGAVVSR